MVPVVLIRQMRVTAPPRAATRCRQGVAVSERVHTAPRRPSTSRGFRVAQAGARSPWSQKGTGASMAASELATVP